MNTRERIVSVATAAETIVDSVLEEGMATAIAEMTPWCYGPAPKKLKPTPPTDQATTADTNTLTNLRCKVCLDAKVQVAILPCAHVTTCLTCTVKLKNCPICRRTIKDFMVVFFP